MTMILDSATVAEMRQSAPDLFAQVDALRAAGKPIAHILVDEDTDEVFISEGLGQPYQKAPAAIREMVTGIPARDPAEVDPVIAAAALRDPILRSRHAAEVREMLLHLIGFYRPALMQHPRLDPALDAFIELATKHRTKLAAYPTVYKRWDFLAGGIITFLEGEPWSWTPEDRE